MEKKASSDVDKQAPDSTTKGDNCIKECTEFTEGEDVLVALKDGRFYLGTVVKICVETEKCLVKFGDGTDRWSPFKDLTRLSVPEADAVMCVACKSSQIKPDNKIIVCEDCSRGFHQKCHQPTIKSEEVNWKCRRCKQCNDNCQASLSSMTSNTSSSSSSACTIIQKTVSSTSKDCTLLQSTDELPYEINDLVWDIHHTMNTSQQYCYCGKTGDWFVKMIQCGQCLQWFHEKCVHCLIYPLYLGDRFYVFICSICNLGEEFVRRIEMKWADMVHLVIFNLIAYRAKKYYDLDSEIVKYVNSHWNALQLPPKIYNVAIDQRRRNILNALSKNRHRFKCFDKIKKPETWGLRNRDAPAIPHFTLPSDAFPLTDKKLKILWKDNNRLKTFFPLNSYNGVSLKTNIPNGIKPSEAGLKLLHTGTKPLLLPKGMSATGHKVCIKSATPFHTDRSTIERRIQRQQEIEHRRLRSLNSRKSEPIISSCNNISNSNSNNQVSNNSQPELPPTPPLSVSAPETPQSLPAISNGAPPTPPAEDTSSSENVDTFFVHKSSAITDDCISVGHNVICSTDGLFFNIKDEEEEIDIKPQITLPLPLKHVITDRIVRPMKRHLSEKDIIVTESGEVKRRRIRRQSSILINKVKLENSPSPCSKKYSEQGNNRSVSTTPVKQSSTVASSSSTNDLKSLLYSYFGAATRISGGDCYTVLGKRKTTDGRIEHLIEWNNTNIL